MKYIIYSLVKPTHLKEIEQDGYYTKFLERSVLERLNVTGVDEEHSTMESAVGEIIANGEKLKYLELTILPVFSVAWDGTMY
jgi:hypothetical protein